MDEQSRLRPCLHGVHYSASDQCYTCEEIFEYILANCDKKRADILTAVYPQTGDLINKINHNTEENIFFKIPPCVLPNRWALAKIFLVRTHTLLCWFTLVITSYLAFPTSFYLSILESFMVTLYKKVMKSKVGHEKWSQTQFLKYICKIIKCLPW